MIKIDYAEATNEEILDHLLRIAQKLIFKFPKIDSTPIFNVYHKIKGDL